MFSGQIYRSCCAATTIALAATVLPLAAHANSTSGVNSTAAVLASCTIVGSTIAFGSYTSTQVDQTGSIAVVCTSGVSYSIGLDAGAGSGATTAVRKLTGSQGGTLNYALYSDSARTSNWGSTIGTDTQSGNGNGITQNLTVYGRIPSGQTPQTGVYTDTVTITLTY